MPDYPYKVTIQRLLKEGPAGAMDTVWEDLKRLRAELPENASFDVLDPLVRTWMESPYALALFESLSEVFSGQVTVHLQNAFNLARSMASAQEKTRGALGAVSSGLQLDP